MTLQLSGTPSDELPDVLASGTTDVRRIFISMSEREPSGKDADYLEWHSLDHRPEQYRVAGIRHSLRIVSTPACRAARVVSDARFDRTDHVMTYFFAADAALDRFGTLSAALCGDRRPFRLPSVFSSYFTLKDKAASRRAIAGADVIPWRPSRGVYLVIEQGSLSPAALVDLPGVAGAWSHAGDASPTAGFSDHTGLQITYCYLDEDPLDVAARLRPSLESRWASGEVTPLFAAPFYTLVPFEWRRHLP